MKIIKLFISLQGFIFFLLVLFSKTGYSQAGSTVHMTFTNLVQTNANTFEYGVMVTNNGPVIYYLRAYSWGLNATPGLANGGTISHTFLCRDAIFNTIPPVVSVFTASSNPLRATTTPASPGNEVLLTPGVAYRIARMRVKTTAPIWAPNFNPFTPILPLEPIQVIYAPGKTQCVVAALVNPPGVIYNIQGIANASSPTTVEGLTASMDPDPLGANPFLLNCSTCPVGIPVVACESYTWPASGLTYTNSGTYSQFFAFPGGCDSTATILLTINHNSFSTTNQVVATPLCTTATPIYQTDCL